MDCIIVVYGKSGTGKTTIINDVYNNLIQKGAAVKMPRKQVGANPKDFEAVLTYQNKSSAFMSVGDYRLEADQAVVSYRAENILIVAYNTRHATLKSDWLKNTSVIQIVKKSSPTPADNMQAEQQVVGLI